MDLQSKPKTSAKDFFLNLGAIVAFYTTVVSLINLLFTVINTAHPQITNDYYYGSQSISFSVATLIIFFPIYILFLWVLEKDYVISPERKQIAVRRWLTYITLFVAGLTLAGDLVTVLYYFIDGQELTMGFLLKVLTIFVVTLAIFLYYISDLRNTLNPLSRKVWVGISVFIILSSIIWGFAVLGSPRTQQLMKYDVQKVNDLQNLGTQIQNYYLTKGVLPISLNDLAQNDPYFRLSTDQQTGQPYEYQATSTSTPYNKTYKLCATFNRTSDSKNDTSGTHLMMPYYGNPVWNHQGGYFCFTESVSTSQYPGGKLPM